MKGFKSLTVLSHLYLALLHPWKCLSEILQKYFPFIVVAKFTNFVFGSSTTQILLF